MRELRLSGLDLSEASPRLLVRFTPHLSRLDLSQCEGVTDQAVHTITSSVSPLRESLTHLSLAGEELLRTLAVPHGSFSSPLALSVPQAV